MILIYQKKAGVMVYFGGTLDFYIKCTDTFCGNLFSFLTVRQLWLN